MRKIVFILLPLIIWPSFAMIPTESEYRKNQNNQEMQKRLGSDSPAQTKKGKFEPAPYHVRMQRLQERQQSNNSNSTPTDVQTKDPAHDINNNNNIINPTENRKTDVNNNNNELAQKPDQSLAENKKFTKTDPDFLFKLIGLSVSQNNYNLAPEATPKRTRKNNKNNLSNQQLNLDDELSIWADSIYDILPNIDEFFISQPISPTQYMALCSSRQYRPLLKSLNWTEEDYTKIIYEACKKDCVEFIKEILEQPICINQKSRVSPNITYKLKANPNRILYFQHKIDNNQTRTLPFTLFELALYFKAEKIVNFLFNHSAIQPLNHQRQSYGIIDPKPVRTYYDYIMYNLETFSHSQNNGFNGLNGFPINAYEIAIATKSNEWLIKLLNKKSS